MLVFDLGTAKTKADLCAQQLQRCAARAILLLLIMRVVVLSRSPFMLCEASGSAQKRP